MRVEVQVAELIIPNAHTVEVMEEKMKTVLYVEGKELF
jgi:hypothetical protein